jgi:hypothetical protein
MRGMGHKYGVGLQRGTRRHKYGKPAQIGHPMPRLIRTIDEIAREKQRDVIFVQFHNFSTGFVADYRTNPSREAIISWLDEQHIAYVPCGGFDSGCIVEGYDGELYIDVAIDEDDDNFFKLTERFIGKGGQRRYENAWLFYLPLVVAMLNSNEEGRDPMSSVS